jgi:hypothetical protein
LHLAIIQSSSVREDSQRITRERRLREYVNLNEFVGAVWHKKTFNLCLRTRKANINFRGANYSGNGVFKAG